MRIPLWYMSGTKRIKLPENQVLADLNGHGKGFYSVCMIEYRLIRMAWKMNDARTVQYVGTVEIMG